MFDRFREKGNNKSENKDILEQNGFVRNVGVIKYKYTLYKAKEQGYFYKDITSYFDHLRIDGSDIYHVKNDELATLLYEAITNNKVNYEEMPEVFRNTEFVIVKKYKKVVFIKCNHTITSDEQWLQNSVKLASWFSEAFSAEEKKININYKILFDQFVGFDRNFLGGFFRALYVDQKNYELSQSDFEFIIFSLLKYCDKYDYLSLEEVREKLSSEKSLFYNYLKNGVYLSEEDSYGYNRLPMHMYINIFKYAINPNCFSKLDDFFDDSFIVQKDIMRDKSSNIIFDLKLFESSIESVKENANFTSYKNKPGAFGENVNSSFLLIKNNEEVSNMQSALKELNDAILIEKTDVVCSAENGRNYLHYFIKQANLLSLSDYIKKAGKDSSKISKLIEEVEATFSDKSFLRQKLFFDKNINYLDILYINEYDEYFTFGDITKMAFSKEENNISFQYTLVLLQIVEAFMARNSIDVEDIFKCGFSKMFPKPFMNELIEYIKTKQYKSKGMIGKLREFLTAELESKIEFLENISTDDTELLSKVTFLSDYKEEKLIKDIEQSKEKLESSFSGIECICLDENMDYVVNKGSLLLSKNLINKLTDCFNTSAFLVPQKVIISKDIYTDENYKVVGVIWNRADLYKLSDIIKNKNINSKNIYQILVYKLVELYTKGYFISNMQNGIGSLLMDCNFDIVFDCNSFTKLEMVGPKSHRSIQSYYSAIINSIHQEFDNDLEDMTYFSFDDMKSFSAPTSNSLTTEDIVMINAKNMCFCKEHNKLYLRETICPDCREVYEFKGWVAEMLYQDEVSKFFNHAKKDRLSGNVFREQKNIFATFDKGMSHNLIQRIKTGIKNGLYNKYAALVPQKILLDDAFSGEIKRPVGLLYSYYGFSNIMDIDDFKYTQRFKVVLMLYKKILPYIRDYSFIAFDEAIFTTMFMDREYKGEIIIPNIHLLRCEISAASDEKVKTFGQQKTLKLFSKFILEYLLFDESIADELKHKETLITKIIDDIKAQNFDEDLIREYLHSKDSYCKIHGKYFSSSDRICVDCIDDGIVRERAIVKDVAYFDHIRAEKAEYEGGEAILYTDSNGKIIKLFNDKVDSAFKSKVIGKALQKAEYFEKFNSEHDDIKFVQIDKILYSSNNNVLRLEGYTQEFIEGSFKISSFKEKAFAEKMGYERKDVVEILIKVSKAIEFLHSIGCFIGDLNGGNILIKDKMVYIIDMDGMSYDDVRNCMCTDMYIYPPSKENHDITQLDDWYSFAVQAFYYLTYSHPFRGISANSRIPQDEIGRMRLGYSVLGNHGIKVPSVSIGWEFIPKDMLKFFLYTFEGPKRESMLSILESYLDYINNNEISFKKIQRQYAVIREINEKMYVDSLGNVRYNETPIYKVRNGSALLVCEDKDCILISSSNDTCIINQKTGYVFSVNKVYPEQKYFYDNKIFYTKPDDTNVYIDEIDTDTRTISTHVLKRATNNKVEYLTGKGIDKLVFIEENDIDSTYDVYCNSNRIFSMTQSEFFEYTGVKILYDEVADGWMILFIKENMIRGIVINKVGELSEFALEIASSESYSFYRNVLYFVDDEKILCYNVNTKTLKSVYSKEVTKESRILRIDDKFVINNEQESYIYVKS